MKIALSGTSSTGKTTLLNDLMKFNFFQENEYTTVQINTRSILTEMGLRADGNGCDPKAMRKLQWRILEEKQKKEAKEDLFVTDRSYLDLAAYWMARTKKTDQETITYLNACLKAAARYTTHVFLPFGRIPFKEDGFRPADLGFLQEVSNEIYAQLKKSSYTQLILKEGNRTRSVELILAHLNSL